MAVRFYEADMDDFSGLRRKLVEYENQRVAMDQRLRKLTDEEQMRYGLQDSLPVMEGPVSLGSWLKSFSGDYSDEVRAFLEETNPQKKLDAGSGKGFTLLQRFYDELRLGAPMEKDDFEKVMSSLSPDAKTGMLEVLNMTSEHMEQISQGALRNAEHEKNEENRLNLMNCFTKMLNNMGASHDASHHNSDLSGIMYGKISAALEKMADGNDLSQEDWDGLKKSAKDYLLYKKEKGYNEKAYGKISAAFVLTQMKPEDPGRSPFGYADMFLDAGRDTWKAMTDDMMGKPEIANLKKEPNRKKVSYTKLLRNNMQQLNGRVDKIQNAMTAQKETVQNLKNSQAHQR